MMLKYIIVFEIEMYHPCLLGKPLLGGGTTGKGEIYKWQRVIVTMPAQYI